MRRDLRTLAAAVALFTGIATAGTVLAHVRALTIVGGLVLAVCCTNSALAQKAGMGD